MDRIDKNGTTIFIFILIIISIVIGGYFLIKNRFNESTDNKTYTNNQEKVKIDKIDNNKDYIYFINEDIESEEEELIYKDIVINFNCEDAKNIENELNDKIKKKRKTVKKENDEVIESEGIDFEIIESSKYISIIANEYNFNIDEGKDSKNIDYYVFDLYTGKLLNNNDILKKENIKEEDIINRIKKYLEKEENIDINKTLKNDYYLTIGKNGKIIINIIVNSDNINYNDSVEMD